MNQFLIDELEDELISLVKGVPAFKDSGWSVFDLQDLINLGANATVPYPIAGVMYEGCSPFRPEGDNDKREVRAASSGATSVVLLDVQYSVIIGVQYGYAVAGIREDSKRKAFALLNTTRPAILGYVGKSGRPWRFVGERPELDASDSSVVYYSQVWQTRIPQVGSTIHA